jgi:site-specific DNA-cytosine methylase
MALKLLRIQPCGYIAIEVDKFARKVVRESSPEVYHINDVQEVTEETVRQWRAWHGSAEMVLHVGGFPCQDLSSLSADRKGLGGEKSSLFAYTLKV